MSKTHTVNNDCFLDEYDILAKYKKHLFDEYVMPTTFNKDAVFNDCPHYSDPKFKKEQTVYGEPEKGLGYDYSDRIWQWDYAKAKKSVEAANKSGAKDRTCRWYEAYLTEFFGRPIEIRHIVAGVNHSNGYPYLVFGYRDRKEDTEAKKKKD